MGNRAGSQELIQLGERIRQKRKDSHLTQETFAEKAGISVNTVSRIEGGQAGIRKKWEILPIGCFPV